MIAFLLGAALGAVVVLLNFMVLSHIWKRKEMKAIQISRENLGTVMQLPCVEMCFKTVSGHFRFKGSFESKAHYARENDWLVQVSDNKWRAMPNAEYQRIKDKL